MPLGLIAARAIAPLDTNRRASQVLLVAWCAALVLARALPAFVDVPEDDRAIARALASALPAPPNEVAFVETEPRYGLRFYLDSEIERLELPGDAPKPQAQDIRSEMGEREGCRVMLVNESNLPQLEAFLAKDSVPYRRLPDVRSYAAIAQLTPDCPAYSGL